MYIPLFIKGRAGLSLIFQVDGESKKVAGGQKKSGERGGGFKV